MCHSINEQALIHHYFLILSHYLYLRFTLTPPPFFFLFWVSIQGYMWHSVFLDSFWLGQFLRLSLYLTNLTILRKFARHFGECSSTRIYLHFFLVIRLGLWEEEHRGNMPFLSLIAADTGLGLLAEVLVFRFLYCKHTPFYAVPYFMLWKEVIMCSLHLKSWKLCSFYVSL